VWICTSSSGHLQAVGTDAAGRRQYRYHNEWTAARGVEKHERMLDLAACLPAVRRTVDEGLDLRGMPRDRCLSAALRMLDHGFFRVGSESYRIAHGTFGLATLRRDHVSVSRDSVSFSYVAKGGLDRKQRLVDPSLARAVRTLLRREDNSAELLAWRERSGWRDLRSPDVNAFIRQVTGGEFTAKDFRTWNATVLMAQALAVSGGLAGPRERQRAVVRAVQEVARYLGNTPAVARASYIDPRVVDLYLDGITVDVNVIDRTVRAPGLAIHGPLEAAVLRMLRDPQKRGAGKA
jgi:DNA topoisomerase IB